MKDNAKRNRAATASLRAKHAKEFSEKVYNWKEKFEEKFAKIGFQVDTVTDTETGEHLNKEDYLLMLQNMQPKQKQNGNEQKNSAAVSTRSIPSKKWWKS